MYRPGMSNPRLGCRHSEALACFTFRPTRQDDATGRATTQLHASLIETLC